MQIHSILKRTLFFSPSFSFLSRHNRITETWYAPTTGYYWYHPDIFYESHRREYWTVVACVWRNILGSASLEIYILIYARYNVPNLAACFALNRVEFDERYICIRDQISPDTGQSQTIFLYESRGSSLAWDS